jgi:hypothetical protein
VGVEGKGQLWYIGLHERDHSAVFHADDVGSILLADVVRTRGEANGGGSGLHFDVILDGDGHSKQGRQMLIWAPLFPKGKIILSGFKTFTITLLGFSKSKLKVVLRDNAKVSANGGCPLAVDGH